MSTDEVYADLLPRRLRHCLKECVHSLVKSYVEP